MASVPKTIDNDLPETDHCPGYGSIARYLGNAVRDATYDSIASPQLHPVKFVEVMGRDAGWVAASGALGFGPNERDLRTDPAAAGAPANRSRRRAGRDPA